MAKVRVEPLGIELEIHPGETVMEAAVRLGYGWPTLCHGEGSCAICWIEVTEGVDHLSPLRDEERESLQLVPGRRFVKGMVRLACRTSVNGDVVVKKRGVTRRTPEVNGP